MKKKLGMLSLVIALLLPTLGIPALASDNMSLYLSTNSGAYYLEEEVHSGDGWEYDPQNHILTLNGLTDGGLLYADFLAVNADLHQLEIVLHGTNQLSRIALAGADCDLIISGDGTLSVSQELSNGIKHSITVNSGTINISSGSSSGSLMRCNKLIINGGTVNVDCTSTSHSVIKGVRVDYAKREGLVDCEEVIYNGGTLYVNGEKQVFSDVPYGIYYYSPVYWAVDKSITNGTGATTFSPETTCTRTEIITFLWRAAGSPEPTGSNPFYDVTAGSYYEKAAAWAAEQGMVSGSAFAPDDPCTRSMAVEFLWKQAGSPSASEASFTDVASNATYADAVNWAVKKGVTNGTSKTTFSPDTVCTRAQIVTFLYRSYND